MFSKLLTIALLAILGCQAQKSPSDFLIEAEKTLRNTFAKCQPLADEPTTYLTVGLDHKIKILADLETCAGNLEDISRQAREYNLNDISDATVKQAILLLGNIESKFKMGSQLIEAGSSLSAMNNAFEQQNIDVFDDDQKLSLRDIEKTGIMWSSESVDELDYYWRQAADEVAAVTQDMFFNFVKLVRREAKTQNLSAAEFWYPNYSEATMAELEQVMQQLKPFYAQLHAYTRHKILQKYGAGVIKPNGPIPEHLYKQFQMRAWDENNKYLNDDFPFEKLPSYKALFIDSLGYEPSAHAVLEIAENFYESLGFDGFTQDFWQQRIIKSTDETAGCVSKVYDNLPDNLTFVYCNENDLDAFGADHEHLGRVHSALLKQKLPLYFYDGNFLGEPFGRAVKLSAYSPQHLKAIGLAKTYDFSADVKTNVNLRLCFETLFTLNYEYVHARLITDFLDGKVKRKQLNRHYWKLLEDYAGIEPPIDRHEDSFDLPYQLIVKFMTNRNLIRDFENSILAFQFYKAACDKIGHRGHLSECDFYNHKSIGNDFKQVLSLGSTKPFDQLISPILTNSKLNADGLLAYFDITNDWLKSFNAAHQITIGWEHTNKQIPLETELYANDSVEQVANIVKREVPQNDGTTVEQETDTHEYYNSTKYNNEAEVATIWNEMMTFTPDPLLSNSHRKAKTVELKFDFPFYGQMIRNVTIATGGFLFTGETVHSYLAATQYVAPFMANFNTTSSDDSHVRFHDNGTAFTVVWENVRLADEENVGNFSFLTILHKSGEIVFAYYKIPISSNAVSNEIHPVKVGLSDAYFKTRVQFLRRKTIYEYHRINFTTTEITNSTVIRLTPLPSCPTYKDCNACMNNLNTAFKCHWCPRLNRCSSGFDRGLEEWLHSGCDKTQINDIDNCSAGEEKYEGNADSTDELKQAEQ